ncbi:hypothetical protein [Blastococcus goldschmidtiae]|uniref:Uncharacterized protein n=1 Tax=Blastococcus goldschmidtiae TaxID=3075546 RepID=A0ABU2K3Z2_9ACTN|nr:hypothetical protein [Blastococcus sp. DSM 46792]MDT0274904.1 hypothetical protein [Blastococcus sp. DSM 46792]
MSIDMPAEQVRALGRSLTGRAGTAQEVRARLLDATGVDGPLQTPVGLFLECHGTLAAALAAELDRLGTTVTGVADSWLQLDAALVPGPGAEPGR